MDAIRAFFLAPIHRVLALLALAFLLGNCVWSQDTTPAISEYTLPVARSAPNLITSGPDGNLWFTQEFNDQIGKITPGGTITEYPVPTIGENYAFYMTAGPDGKVWFSSGGIRKVVSVTATGIFTEHPLPQGQSPNGITLGPDGNIWFTDDLGQHIGKIDSTGTVTEFTVLTGGSPSLPPTPHGLTTGPDGNLWFAEYGTSKIGRITTSGVLTEYPLPVANSRPECIVPGPDGNLWFTELRGAIGKITPEGVIAEYSASVSEWGMIARGPDGALWFPEGSNKIARITANGAISEYSIPTAGSFPYGIAAGPDGNLWFTERSANRIGKVVLSNPVPTGPVNLSQSSLTFNAPYLGTPSAPQTFTVSAATPTSFSVTLDSNYIVVGDTPWLTIAPSGVLSTDQTITVGVNQSILVPGSYSGSISIVAGGAIQKVQVTLNVMPTTGGDVYTNVSLLQAGCTIGSIEPCTMELQVISKSSSTQKNPFVISTSVPAPTGGDWLSLVSPDGTVVPSGSTEVTNWAVEVTVNTKGLAAGKYTGMVTITPNGGAVVNIPVSVTLFSATTPAPTLQAVVNSASLAAGGLSPGEIITVYGTGLGPATPLGTALDNLGKVATSLGGATILINGRLAPLIYVSQTQINCVVPYEAAGKPVLSVQAAFFGTGSDLYEVAAASTAPGVFTLNGSGTGPGAILNGAGGVNGPNNRAASGSTIVIFLTGEGQTNPAGVSGAVTAVNTSPDGPLTPQPLNEPVVKIGGSTAQVSFYGEAPGMVSGVLQINAVVPTGLPAGDLPLIVSIAGADSQPGVTVSVQ